MFDTSDLPKNKPHYSEVNKKILGLRPKLYAMLLDGDQLAAHGDHSLKLETKKSKGVSRAIVKKQLNFDSYMKCLETGQSQRNTQYNLRSRDHVVHTEECTKISLSAFDSKRYVLDDGITTLAHGHYQIS